MVLRPLEFSDCISDSPFFRETLQAHEKELENTAESIKGLVKACKRLLVAAKELSKAQRCVAEVLQSFKLELIGDSTDDESLIVGAFKEFAALLSAVEEQRDRFLEQAEARLIAPLEAFRKEQVQAAKDHRKSFERSSLNYCKALEGYLSLSTRKKESALQESDDTMSAESTNFLKVSCDYVHRLQDVQLRKKFDFVEPLLGFMHDQMTFYHQGYEYCREFAPQMEELQYKLQIAREQYDEQQEQTKKLRENVEERAKLGDTRAGEIVRQGYLFLQKTRMGGLGFQSTKHFCQYLQSKGLFVMFPYNQQQGKLSNPETFKVDSCTRRATDSIDKRFCFDITSGDKLYTLQALSMSDRSLWLSSLDGKEPDYMALQHVRKADKSGAPGVMSPAVQVQFVEKCIEAVEAKGLDEEGLYRVSGVGSKVTRLTTMCFEKGKMDKVHLDDAEWEVRTITSALKNFFRNREALLTFRLYPDFLEAAKQPSKKERLDVISKLIPQMPRLNQKLLQILMKHLARVAANADENKMHPSNLGVVFGPTLMRPAEESVAGIMDIKYQNVVVEMMVEGFETLFNSAGESTSTSSTSEEPASSSPTSPTVQPVAGSVTSPTHPAATGPLVGQTSSSQPPSSSRRPTHTAPPVPAAAARRMRKPSEADQPTQAVNRSRTFTESPRPPTSRPPPPPLSGRSASAQVLGPVKADTSHRSESPLSDIVDDAKRPSGGNQPPLPQPRTTASLPRDQALGDGEATLTDTHAAAPPAPPRRRVRKARALYACQAEDDNELSFPAGAIFTDVASSQENGWLQCTYDGKTGLVPENYIGFLS